MALDFLNDNEIESLLSLLALANRPLNHFHQGVGLLAEFFVGRFIAGFQKVTGCVGVASN
jgi:hypothetical protein